MKKSAAEVMKEIKAINEQVGKLYTQERESAYKVVTESGTTVFEKKCDFNAFREKEDKLMKRELMLKVAIDNFNNKTKVDGYDFTIIEGLVRLAQLKKSIDNLERYIKGGVVDSVSYGNALKVLSVDQELVVEKIKDLSAERSALLVAIDKTNLNSSIEI